MSNLKMVLNDGTQIGIETFGLPMHAVLICADDAEVKEKWAQLTSENLAAVQIQQDEETVFAFSDVTLDGLQCVMNGDDSITVHLYMSGTNEGAAYAEAGKILLGEEE